MFLALRSRHVSASNAPDVRKNMNYLANWSSGTSTWKICRVKIVDSSRGSYFHIYVHSSCKWTFWKWWYYCSWCWIYQMKNSSSSPGMLTLWCFYKKLGCVIRENIFINLWLWITTWKFSHIFQNAGQTIVSKLVSNKRNICCTTTYTKNETKFCYFNYLPHHRSKILTNTACPRSNVPQKLD